VRSFFGVPPFSAGQFSKFGQTAPIEKINLNYHITIDLRLQALLQKNNNSGSFENFI